MNSEVIKTCCLYLRYSSSSQTEQSIEGQRRVCLEYCERHGIICVAQYEDRATSASHDTQRRHSFLKMMQDAERQPWDAVMVYKLDRFARNRYDSATYKAKLKKFGIKLISATENLSDSPESIILESVLEGMAEFYSAELSQKIHRGLRESALKCNFAGGQIPLGYKIVDKKYTVDELTAPIVKEAFELYANGSTIREITDLFNEKGYRSSKGAQFNRNSFKKLLTNKRYIGYYIYAGHEVENGIPAIIDKGLFERVQARMKANGSCPARGTGNVDFLLSGKLFCGHCGAAMQGDSGTGRHGVVYYYYTCGERKRNGSCKKKSVKKDYIENIIVKEATSLLTDEYIEHIAEATIKAANAENKKNARIPKLEDKLRDARTAINNIMKAVERGIASDTMLHRIEELEAEAKDYEKQLAAEKSSEIHLTKEMVICWLEKFRKGDQADDVWRHRIIDLLINSVTLWDDPDGGFRVTIAYNLTSTPNKTYRVPLDSDSTLSNVSPPKNTSWEQGVFFFLPCFSKHKEEASPRSFAILHGEAFPFSFTGLPFPVDAL